MPFISGGDRYQVMFTALDDMVAPDSEARVIDAFVGSLDLDAMGFDRAQAPDRGRPAYEPADLLKLYVYGYRNGIRSSRKLARACAVNVEVMWLIGSLAPDFRTVANFRRDNAAALKGVFREFVARVMAGVEPGFRSVDGTKVRASNAKDRNLTPSKLDDRIARLEGHIGEYMRLLDEQDAEDDAVAAGDLPRAELERKLAEAEERLARYEGYREKMESEGLSQLSLTDPDAKLMKSRSGFEVAYNVQAAVDSGTHVITDFEATDRVTDHGLLAPTLAGAASGGGVLEIVADKGYADPSDMAACLDGGIIPNVVLPDGKDSYELEYDHDPSGGDPSSTDPAQLAACLRAGQIPEAYAHAVESAEVVEKRAFVRSPADAPSPGSVEEMRERAVLGFFVRDAERNLVVCPAGELLRQKSVKRNGNIRYANKLACRRCPNKERCISGSGKWKEIDFPKDVLEKPCRRWGGAASAAKAQARGHYETKTVVVVRLRPDRAKCAQRMCLSEHPFGTIKRAMGADNFLLRGLEKVNAEFALMATGYNLARAMSLLGFGGLMEAVRG